MQIIGDRHYKADPGERITFAAGQQTQVGSVVASGPTIPSGPLPAFVIGGGHASVTVAAGFTGSSGGSVVINVSGSNGGSDASRLRQVDGISFRTGLFTVD